MFNMSELRQVLEAVANGSTSVEAALTTLQNSGMAYVDIGDAKLDTHRKKRRGITEAVYCAGKTPDQVLRIAEHFDAVGQNVLCTRVNRETADYVREQRPDFVYHEMARILAKVNERRPRTAGNILVITAGTSDIPVAEEAAICAETMGSAVERFHDCGVAGIHRLFGAASDAIIRARAIIVVAGMEGALPSVVAGLASVPVIAVPTSVGYGAAFGGIAALLGMLNSCSAGISVVNIDNGFGAAVVAHMINSVQAREETT
jgi:NCAIR mutase (PurE)-related protein